MAARNFFAASFFAGCRQVFEDAQVAGLRRKAASWDPPILRHGHIEMHIYIYICIYTYIYVNIYIYILPYTHTHPICSSPKV